MKLEQPKPGDAVFAKCELRNDGSIPGLPVNAVLALEGCRGVIIEKGHLEEDPQQVVYLVRFEDENLELGPPTGCWPEELSVAEP